MISMMTLSVAVGAKTSPLARIMISLGALQRFQAPSTRRQSASIANNPLQKLQAFNQALPDRVQSR